MLLLKRPTTNWPEPQLALCKMKRKEWKSFDVYSNVAKKQSKKAQKRNPFHLNNDLAKNQRYKLKRSNSNKRQASKYN